MSLNFSDFLSDSRSRSSNSLLGVVPALGLVLSLVSCYEGSV